MSDAGTERIAHWTMKRNIFNFTRRNGFAVSKKLLLSSTIQVAKGDIEWPTPLVFVTAELLSPCIWKEQAQIFQRQGYNCLLHTSIPHECNCIDDVADQLNTTIEHHKLTPPVLISHSFSTLVCQRYLESYPASALIMINPIPPDPIRMIRQIRNSALYKSDTVQKYQFLEAHFKLSGSDDQIQEITKRLGQNGLKSFTTIKLLRKRSYKMLRKVIFLKKYHV